MDCVLLQGPEYRRYHIAVAELRKGLPFLDIKIVDEEEYNFYAEFFFSNDRDFIPKGVMEVIL